MKSGRVIYGWPPDDGGIPPKLESIKQFKVDKDVTEKVRSFVEALLGQHTALDRSLKEMLVANGLRLFADFLQVLKDEPLKKFSSVEEMKTNDVFVHRVHVSLCYVTMRLCNESVL